MYFQPADVRSPGSGALTGAESGSKTILSKLNLLRASMNGKYNHKHGA
jgi:hypothetical protein